MSKVENPFMDNNLLLAVFYGFQLDYRTISLFVSSSKRLEKYSQNTNKLSHCRSPAAKSLRCHQGHLKWF